jgi:hypothetical protein
MFKTNNSILSIENRNGETILAIEIENGKIKKVANGSVADITEDYIFDTNKELIRIQED